MKRVHKTHAVTVECFTRQGEMIYGETFLRERHAWDRMSFLRGYATHKTHRIRAYRPRKPRRVVLLEENVRESGGFWSREPRWWPEWKPPRTY